MVVPDHPNSVSISPLRGGDGPAEQRIRLMTYTYRILAGAPENVSISPLRGGDRPAWPSSPARGLTYDLYLQKSDRTYLSFDESLQ